MLSVQPCLSASVRLAPAPVPLLSGGVVWKRVWSGIGGSCQCCVPPLSLFLDQADRRADFVVVVVVFNEFKDLSFSFYTLASP